MRSLLLACVLVLTAAVDPHTLFYELRTDVTNDSGNLSFYSINLLAPSTAPKLAGSLSNVPGGSANFGIDPVREFLYFDQYQFFDQDHEGVLFGRFALATPNKIEHLSERTRSEPGGLRVAPGSRIGETYFTTCVQDPVSGKHSSVVLRVFDNGDLDVRNVATFSPDMVDDKSCRIPVAYSSQEPTTVFVGGSNSTSGVVYVVPRETPTKKFPIAVKGSVVSLAYMNGTLYVLSCQDVLRLFSLKPVRGAQPALVASIPGTCDQSYRWQMASDPLDETIYLVAANQTSVLQVQPATQHVAPVVELPAHAGLLQGVHVPWWED